MPKFSVIVGHRLPKDEALARIKGLLAEVKSEHGDKVSRLEEVWDGCYGSFDLTAAGFSISGSLEVTESEVVVSGKIPMLAAMFKGQIESMIRSRASSILMQKASFPDVRPAVQEERFPLSDVPKPEGSSPDADDRQVCAAKVRIARSEREIEKLLSLSEDDLKKKIDLNKRLDDDMREHFQEHLASLSEKERLVVEAYAMELAAKSLIFAELDFKLYRLKRSEGFKSKVDQMLAHV